MERFEEAVPLYLKACEVEGDRAYRAVLRRDPPSLPPRSRPTPTARLDALTNAFLHAGAGRVEVRLDFGADCIRLSVSDDGVGLPDDYAERGRGFRGMRADAERLGGRLIVETGGLNGGTTVTCTTPYR